MVVLHIAQHGLGRAALVKGGLIRGTIRTGSGVSSGAASKMKTASGDQMVPG